MGQIHKSGFFLGALENLSIFRSFKDFRRQCENAADDMKTNLLGS